MSNLKTYVFLTSVAMLITGCSNDGLPVRAPVTGIVMFHGKVLSDAEVTFRPPDGGRVAMGRTDAEGRFTLGTFSIKDGALLGQHVVTVTARGEARERRPNEIGSGMPGEKTLGDPLIPLRYFAPESSGLEFDVKKGKNHFTIELVD